MYIKCYRAFVVNLENIKAENREAYWQSLAKDA
jgi:hypothetical protein